MPHVVPFEFPHLLAVAGDIRAEDQRELELFLGREPYTAIGFIADNATMIQTIIHDDIAVGLFGYNVTNSIERVASPFFVATNYAAAYPKTFARASRESMKHFKGWFLLNYVLASNDVAVKWLEWLGFYVAPPEVYNGLTKVRRFSKDCR